MRFLSHAETMRLFQRACVRAGVKVAYSQGYNPHQRMSLVLPRSVGVESDDELLCLWLAEGHTGIDAEALKSALPSAEAGASARPHPSLRDEVGRPALKLFRWRQARPKPSQNRFQRDT